MMTSRDTSHLEAIDERLARARARGDMHAVRSIEKEWRNEIAFLYGEAGTDVSDDDLLKELES